jgi:hypothetical protein
MPVANHQLPRLALLAMLLWALNVNVSAGASNALQHVAPEQCKQCHEEIYQQWQGSMHAQSSALKDPIHGAFYQMVAGDPTKEGVTLHGKAPVCLKCHAPVAALDGTTKLDSAAAYINGVGCVSCHTFTSFKGSTAANGKPLYGVDAYIIDHQSLHGPTGATYTTDRVAEDATWPTPIPHTVPLQGNAAALFHSNDACMGCHDRRSNFNKVPLCVTGDEYSSSGSNVNCQSCHMGIVSVPKLKDGQVVPGEFVSIADHSMGGGHDPRMLERGLALDMQTNVATTTITATIKLHNRLPHNFPTGAPFRNVFLKVAAYDAQGKELWRNYQVHPIRDDPQAAFWYALGDAQGKPTAPPLATQVLADTRMKPNEERVLTYAIPRTAATAIVRAEVFYDLLLPPIKARVQGKVPSALLRPQLVAAAEVRL